MTVAPPRKNFSWSWSRFKNYRTCPKRHYHVDIARDFKEAKSEYLAWGHDVHEALAEYIGKRIDLPEKMQGYDGWPRRILAAGEAGLTLKVENQLAMNEQFQPCAYYAPEAWFRGVVDVLGIMPVETAAAFSIDWKTGKVEPEFEQLALSAQLVFAHYPKVDHVLAIYVWLGHDTQTVKIYERDKMQQVWNDVMPQVREMEFAARTLTYPPKRSGLCKNYCPVTSCPYHGKGSR
jgi:hypothetical protein